MGSVAMSGNDSLVLQNNIFTGFAEGTPFELTFPNDSAQVKVGKNNNAIYGLNEMGHQADATLRLLRGCPDDQFMNNLQANQFANFAGFVLLQGQFVKQVGDGKGGITSDTYILTGGVFVKPIPAKMNVEGDVEQSVSVYALKFASAPRVLT